MAGPTAPKGGRRGRRGVGGESKGTDLKEQDGCQSHSTLRIGPDLLKLLDSRPRSGSGTIAQICKIVAEKSATLSKNCRSEVEARHSVELGGGGSVLGHDDPQHVSLSAQKARGHVDDLGLFAF